MSLSSTILFVHLGAQLPTWLAGALYQARLFNACPIFLAAEERALAAAPLDPALRIDALPLETVGISEKHRRFRALAPFDRGFRDGFWMFTTERFFVVESAMAKLRLENLLHVENDVLLYCDAATLAPSLAALYPGIAATFDGDQRCVPGLLFIRNGAAIAHLTAYILHALQFLARGNLSAEAKAAINDMALLAMFRAEAPGAIDHLPIVPPDYPLPLRSQMGHVPADPAAYSRYFDRLGLVFDAAALGQYLGGVDPRNAPPPTRGFVNESCVFDPRALRLRMGADAAGRRVPLVETASGTHKVANLHIHAKDPGPFLSR
jgi:hypothetical protein